MSNPKQSWLIRYSYDPLDRLTSQTLSDTSERHRFYCKNRLTTEIKGTIGHAIVQYGDFLLAQQQRQHDMHDTTLLATALQRSVVTTLKKNTERQAIAYSPYGYHRAESGLTSLLSFNGERPDPVTGHYLLGNGYRAFNPVLMRFNSPDSWSPFGNGGLNSHAYCLGDPINLSDPNGHGPRLTSFFEAIRRKFGISGKAIKPNKGSTKKIITPATTASTTHTFTSAATGTGLFESLNGNPHLIENIVQQLPGKDMTALAQTSSEMKDIVYSSARALPYNFKDLKSVTSDNDMRFIFGGFGNPDSIFESIPMIGSGMATGILPVQLPKAGIKIRYSGRDLNSYLGIEDGSGPFTKKQLRKIFTLRKRT